MLIFAAITASPILVAIGSSSLWLVEVSYLPQLWRLYRLKEADEFSFLFPGLNVLGRVAGLALAITQHSPLFGWFFVTGIILRLALLSEVIYYRSRAKKIKADKASDASLAGVTAAAS